MQNAVHAEDLHLSFASADDVHAPVHLRQFADGAQLPAEMLRQEYAVDDAMCNDCENLAPMLLQ